MPQSRPPWARGLKLPELAGLGHLQQSRPPWARGLKHVPLDFLVHIEVAPPVGAWIETIIIVLNSNTLVLLPPRTRGWKRYALFLRVIKRGSDTLVGT